MCPLQNRRRTRTTSTRRKHSDRGFQIGALRRAPKLGRPATECKKMSGLRDAPHPGATVSFEK